MSSLSRLEGKGWQVLSALAKVHAELASEVGITLCQERLPPRSCVEWVIEKWVNGLGKCSPTWRELFRVLKQLNLEAMGLQIEDYLSTSGMQ